MVASNQSYSIWIAHLQTRWALTASALWKFKSRSDSKTKSNPILAFRANKIKNVSTSNCCAESRWIQDLKTFHVLSLCHIVRPKSPSFGRCKNLYQRSHPWKGSSCRGSRPLPVEISDQNGSNSKAEPISNWRDPFLPWTAPPNRRTGHGCPRKSWISAATMNKLNTTELITYDLFAVHKLDGKLAFTKLWGHRCDRGVHPLHIALFHEDFPCFGAQGLQYCAMSIKICFHVSDISQDAPWLRLLWCIRTCKSSLSGSILAPCPTDWYKPPQLFYLSV